MNTHITTIVRTTLLLCLAFPYLSVTSLAQPPPAKPVRPLSLEQALEVAETRSEEIAIARAGVERAGGEQIRARADRYPQLSASASYDRALASEFSGLFDEDTGGAPCDPFVANPLGTIDQRIAELERAVDCGATGATSDGGFGSFDNLPFGRKNTYRLNLSFSQNLYSGGRIRAQSEIASAGRQAAEIALGSARAQLLLAVVRAYYDAALRARLLEIAEATYRQADATFAQVKLGFDAGSLPEFEVLRAQVSRDTQRPAVIRRRSELDIAFIRLKQLLDMPETEVLDLTTVLDGETLPPAAPFAAAATLTAEGPGPDAARAPVRQAESAVTQREAAVAVAKSQRLPSVSVTSTYGEVGYPSGMFPRFGDFRRNWTVGALVQMPILNGGRTRADEIVARADAREAEARLQQARELSFVDTRTAYEELKAALASWEASAGTVQQARRAYDIAELRYREGVSTQLELSDARLLLVQAQATRAEAARDLQVARARIVLLPDLPIGATPAVTGQGQGAIGTSPAQAPLSPARTGAGALRPGGTGGIQE